MSIERGCIRNFSESQALFNGRECVVESKDPCRIAGTSRRRSVGNFSDIWRIKGLAEQGVWPAASDHQEAGWHARGCPGAATGKPGRQRSVESFSCNCLMCHIDRLIGRRHIRQGPPHARPACVHISYSISSRNRSGIRFIFL
jgi:hypothetical protein